MNEETITHELQKYNVTDAAIAILNAEYMALKVKDVNDKKGYEVVKTARIDIKRRRVEVEKTRVTLKAESLEYGRRVDGEAKRITALLTPIEDYLSDQESRVTDELARIKAEAEAKVLIILQSRENRLLDLGCRFDRITESYSYGALVAPVALIKVAPDEAWDKIVSAIQDAVDTDDAKRLAEQALILKVQQEQETERQRLAEEGRKIKAEQDRIAAEQAKERDRLAQEAKAIQEAKDAIAREKKAAEDALLKAEQDKLKAKEVSDALAAGIEEGKRKAEQAVKDADEARIAKELKAKEAAERKMARAPDKVKILLIADILDTIQTPDVKTEDGKAVALAVMMSIAELVKDIRDKVEAL
jgi:hypothetical protein